MKKILAIFALVVVVFSMAGCGQIYDAEPVSIGYDNNELKLFMGLRIASVKWDNVAEIKIVKQGQLNESKNDNVVDNNSDKDCLGINFVSTDIFPRSFINILNLNKTNYGFHVLYSSNYFEKDVNEIYSELTKYFENHH